MPSVRSSDATVAHGQVAPSIRPNARKLSRPVTSRTNPAARSALSAALAVCGVTRSKSASALAVTTGVRSKPPSTPTSRDRRSCRAASPLPFPSISRPFWRARAAQSGHPRRPVEIDSPPFRTDARPNVATEDRKTVHRAVAQSLDTRPRTAERVTSAIPEHQAARSVQPRSRHFSAAISPRRARSHDCLVDAHHPPSVMSSHGSSACCANVVGSSSGQKF